MKVKNKPTHTPKNHYYNLLSEEIKYHHLTKQKRQEKTVV